METLSLREMLWLEHHSAWTDAGLRQHAGPYPRIIHAERRSVGSDMRQWRECSAWSEERIGAAPGIIRGVGLVGPGIL